MKSEWPSRTHRSADIREVVSSDLPRQRWIARKDYGGRPPRPHPPPSAKSLTARYHRPRDPANPNRSTTVCRAGIPHVLWCRYREFHVPIIFLQRARDGGTLWCSQREHCEAAQVGRRRHLRLAASCLELLWCLEFWSLGFRSVVPRAGRWNPTSGVSSSARAFARPS